MNYKEKLNRLNELRLALKKSKSMSNQLEYIALVIDINGLTESEAQISLRREMK